MTARAGRSPFRRHVHLDTFAGFVHTGHMTQTPTPTRSNLIAAGIRDVGSILRDIEPDEMNRADLLAVLGACAAALDLSAATIELRGLVGR